MESRIETLQDRIRESDLDAVLFTNLPDIRWTTGFSGSNGVLLIGGDSAHFVSDGRYTEQAREEVAGAQIHTPG
jgi:Xaa-Pro aminopeptidase